VWRSSGPASRRVAGGGSRCGHSFATDFRRHDGVRLRGVGEVNQTGRPRHGVGVMTSTTRADPLPVRSCRTRMERAYVVIA
jgi:hypothetical protein